MASQLDPSRRGAAKKPKTPVWTIGVACWYAANIVGIVVLGTLKPEEGLTLEELAAWAKPIDLWMTILTTAVPLAPIGVLLAVGRDKGAAGVKSSLDRVTAAVETMCAEQGLSESARRILHRKEERELLIREIEQDINVGDWESAMVLVRELGEGFGYRADAEALRKRVERAREQTDDQRAVDAVAKVQVLIQNRAWPEAYSEAASVLRLFPESHRTQGLRERVGAARDRYRTDLERRFCKAAAEHDTQALELLKELDQYLTPEEAAPYQEVARGVIGQTRENLGSRFKLLVQDHEYAAAVEIGQQIVREFPNTRMAAEVREMMPKLAERAGVSL